MRRIALPAVLATLALAGCGGGGVWKRARDGSEGFNPISRWTRSSPPTRRRRSRPSCDAIEPMLEPAIWSPART